MSAYIIFPLSAFSIPQPGTIFWLIKQKQVMKKLVLYILVGIVFTGCQPATEITGSWKNANVSTDATRIETILVTALSPKTHVRQTVESDMAAAQIRVSKQNFLYSQLKSAFFKESPLGTMRFGKRNPLGTMRFGRK